MPMLRMLRGSTSPGGVSHAVSFTAVPWRRRAAPGASHSSAAGAAERHAADGATSKRSSTPREARSGEGNLRRFGSTERQLNFKISLVSLCNYVCVCMYVCIRHYISLPINFFIYLSVYP